MAVYIPVILVKFFFQFLRYEARRKRAVRAFRKELRAQNMGEEYVELFTKKYKAIGSLRHLVRSVSRGSILSFPRRG